MDALEALRTGLPEATKDIRLNLSSVLADGAPLDLDQRLGCAYAVALATGSVELAHAIRAEAQGKASPAALEDATAAAALAAMNNVYYRFRHKVGSESYAQRSPRLRMNRLAQTAGPRTSMELYVLAVSAYNDCETCVQAHERLVREGGLGEDAVHEAVRIAAVVAGVATALAAARVERASASEHP
jgi:alkyl hydroperoxide reductase subunit D